MALMLKNKAFGSLLISSIFSMLGTSLFNIVFLIYASSLPHAKMMVSLAEICILLPLIFSAYTGFLADKTKHKVQSMIIFSWIQGILFIMLFVVMNEKNIMSFILIAIVKILSDLMTSYKSGLRSPILQYNLKSEDLQPAFGQLQGLSSIVEIIGQPLGVTLLAMSNQSFSFVLMVNGVLYFLSGISLLLFNSFLTYKPLINTKKFEFNMKESFTQIKGIFDVDNSSNFLILLFSLIFINFIMAGVGPLISLTILKFNPFPTKFGTSVMIFNIILMVGMLSGSFIMDDKLKNWDLSKLLLTSFLMISLFSVLVIHYGYLSLVCLFALAYVSAKASPKLSALILENVPQEYLGKIGGGITTIFTFSIPLGGIVFVFLANLIGIYPTFYIVSILSVVVFFCLVMSNKDKKSVNK
ncbi:MFS transporter [Lactococcus paracarnosus]|uniref:MFS transporter n=1 Tax=Pseudolactococcus paracarnosus TaxID=2749962 RepID=A0ABT0ANV7_9LACT|nr:MFS transporter [Lactococcus paracarnosus]MCJ1978158.1 MFS transporter [Lactococcus paracarnosus]MCJ1984267.1 MFS transporter [Lactococcus paracarnosus]MCJ1998559.1 MFS transporter [Lactococcus paracarnosus]